MISWIKREKKYRIPLIVFVAVIGLMTIFGDRGLIRVYKLSQERDSMRGQNEQIKGENAAMKDEISKLKSDYRYIEMIARKDLGMVEKNEMVYKFEK